MTAAENGRQLRSQSRLSLDDHFEQPHAQKRFSTNQETEIK